MAKDGDSSAGCREPFFMVSHQAIDVLPRITGAAAKVLMYLCYRKNTVTGQLNPKIETIMKDVGLTRPTVCEALNQLESVGALSRKRTRGANVCALFPHRDGQKIQPSENHKMVKKANHQMVKKPDHQKVKEVNHLDGQKTSPQNKNALESDGVKQESTSTTAAPPRGVDGAARVCFEELEAELAKMPDPKVDEDAYHDWYDALSEDAQRLQGITSELEEFGCRIRDLQQHAREAFAAGWTQEAIIAVLAEMDPKLKYGFLRKTMTAPGNAVKYQRAVDEENERDAQAALARAREREARERVEREAREREEQERLERKRSEEELEARKLADDQLLASLTPEQIAGWSEWARSQPKIRRYWQPDPRKSGRLRDEILSTIKRTGSNDAPAIEALPVGDAQQIVLAQLERLKGGAA